MLPVERIEEVSRLLLERAIGRGASMADVIYSDSVTRTLSMRDGEVETSRSSQTGGIGLRVVDSEGRQGVASGNGFDKNSLTQIVDWAMDNCGLSEPDPWVTMAPPTKGEDLDLDLWDPEVPSISGEERLERCSEMHSLASSMDKRIISVRSASWSDGVGLSFYANSLGVASWHRGSIVGAGLSLVAEEGQAMEMGGAGFHRRHLEDMDLSLIAQKAVEDVVRTLNGRPIPSGLYDLYLPPEGASSLLDVLSEMLFASSVQKGRSLFRDRLGASVGSSCLTVVDDGRLIRGMGSSCLDGEGVPCSRKVLIDQGKLKGFLHCLSSAKKEGVEPTGNGFRGISSNPDVDVTNLFIEKGENHPEYMISRIDRGLWVSEFQGLHTVNSVTGEFSLGAKGTLIENGTVKGPVSGVTVAGNLLDLIGNISYVGNDLIFFGDIGAPSLVIRDVALAGA
nr:TldD/PmbA family protein [uncultured Dethiosulfovibrio sp.]